VDSDIVEVSVRCYNGDATAVMCNHDNAHGSNVAACSGRGMDESQGRRFRCRRNQGALRDSGVPQQRRRVSALLLAVRSASLLPPDFPRYISYPVLVPRVPAVAWCDHGVTGVSVFEGAVRPRCIAAAGIGMFLSEWVTGVLRQCCKVPDQTTTNHQGGKKSCTEMPDR
jgi:hypothetical protein